MSSNLEQNENLTTLGFVTSQMRRSLVIAFIVIILGAWYFDHKSLEQDKLNCGDNLKEAERKYDEAIKSHLEDLKAENEYRKQLEERQAIIEQSRKQILREIKQINE